jgi:hypothetical protein
MTVIDQDENTLKELEARQKLIPYVPSATSYRMGWKTLHAVRYCNSPASGEFSLPPVSRHGLVLADSAWPRLRSAPVSRIKATFAFIFKRITGVTPRGFRENANGKSIPESSGSRRLNNLAP